MKGCFDAETCSEMSSAYITLQETARSFGFSLTHFPVGVELLL